MPTRIDLKFQELKKQNRSGLVTYLMAGDPDYETSLAILQALPQAGSDLIELGMPFSDPMADGPVIQAAGRRALQAGQTLAKTLAMVAEFRRSDHQTPIILMGYYNPIYVFGVERFLQEAKRVGVDGLLIVDLPPEMDEELCLPTIGAGLNFIRLATPTTDKKRLPIVLRNASGFIYYISMTGITGQSIKDMTSVGERYHQIKEHTSLPIAVGFGIKSVEDAATIAKFADAVVVGSAIVKAVASSVEDSGAKRDSVKAVCDIVTTLAGAMHRTREKNH